VVIGLTPAGLAAIKAWVIANQGGRFDEPTRQALNAPAPPTYIVWRTVVSRAEIQEDPAFDWTRVIALTVDRARGWDWMFQGAGTIDPSKPNIRAGISATWSLPADDATEQAVFAHCKRTCSVVEQLLATGTGTTATPATMTAEGELTLDELGRADG
jgi:hypothetical protein